MTPWGPGYRELAVRQHMANVQKAPATNLLSTSSPPEVHGHSPQCVINAHGRRENAASAAASSLVASVRHAE